MKISITISIIAIFLILEIYFIGSTLGAGNQKNENGTAFTRWCKSTFGSKKDKEEVYKQYYKKARDKKHDLSLRLETGNKGIGKIILRIRRNLAIKQEAKSRKKLEEIRDKMVKSEAKRKNFIKKNAKQ